MPVSAYHLVCRLRPVNKMLRTQARRHEHGNMLFMILIAVALIGLLTAALMSGSNSESSNIDEETLVIRTTEAQRYAAELERAVSLIIQNGKSEADIRFAHPDAASAYGDLSADTDKKDQAFHSTGGAAEYRDPPAGLNDGTDWQFYGHTAVPGVGTSAPDLVMVLPKVTEDFCARINTLNGQVTPSDPNATGTATCIYGGSTVIFNGTTTFTTGGAINQMNAATFTQDPASGAARVASEACVTCIGANGRHYYHVLLAR